MVKGSNSLKNKKLHSSKPYDVSNSFVKKVTSHVTNLLPQPTWLSKWFSSNVDEGHRRDALNLNDSGSEEDGDDDNTNIHPPPSKRVKIPLKRQFPANSFKVSPVVNDEESDQRASTSRMSTEHLVNDGAVAGPSGIKRRPPLVSSTPNVEPSSANLLTSSERKLNGDDRSESSESTSGCSSLVPQANRQFQASQIVASNLSARRRSIDEKLNFTGHLQSPRSLFSDRSYHRSPRPNSSLSRRRPSFDVSTFGSPVAAQDRIALQSRIVNSPFYAGKTTFGGASAYRKLNSFQSPSEVTAAKRYGVQVKPTNCETDTLSTMSTTARRILEALEQFSTPVLDAKRIPVQSSTPPLGSKRKRPNEAGLSPSLRIGQIPRTPNSARPLLVPTVPDLLKMKHREKLQDTMEAARLIAASSSINSIPVCPSTPSHGYKLRFEEDEKSGRYGGKIRSKEKALEEETIEAVNLPNISLPITSLPKFDFVVPPATSSTSPVVSTIKFASPITVTENARTCKPVDNFTFSKPLSIGDKDSMNHNTKKVNCIDTSIPNCPVKLSEMQFRSGSGNNLVSAEKGESKSIVRKSNSQSSSEVVFGIKVAEELKTGSVMDFLGKMSNSVGNKNSKEVSSSSLDMFKPAPGMWECSSCMIRNKSDVTKCVCCETPRTAVSTPNSKTVSNSETWICKLCNTSNTLNFKLCSKCSADRSVQNSSQMKEPAVLQEKPLTSASDFGSKFKPPSGTWECNVCLVRNPESLTQCQACETKRPGLANKSLAPPAALSSKPTTGSGFGEKFKKPEGSWECPDCMLQNKNDSLKCVACERAKPGSETKTASTIKFNYTIPAEASGFKFGLDKAGDTSKEPAIQPASTQGFKFGETKVTTASNFTFGVNANVQNVTKSEIGTTVTSVVTTPSFNFDTKAFSSPVSSVNMKPSDTITATTTTFSQPGFTFGVSQPSKFQSPAPSETRKPEEAPKKRRASITSETVVDSKTVKSKKEEGTSRLSRPAGTSSDTLTVSKSTEEKSEQKDQPAKKVTFSFGSTTPSSANFINEKPNTATKAAESAKPSFSFGASSAGLNFNSGKSASFSFNTPAGTTSSSIFGSSAPSTTANAGTNSTTVSTVAATSTVSTPFTLGTTKSPIAFGSSPSNPAYGQSPATTSAATLPFGAGLKTTSPVSTFSFGSQSKSFSVGSNESATTSKSQIPTFGSTTISAFGTSVTATTTSTTTITTTSTATSGNTTPSLPSFGVATCTPSFNLGAKSTIPAFGTPNTTTTASTTTSTGFGSIASPNFSSKFSDQNKSVSKSVSSPAPFTFGSSTNSTSGLGTSAAPFSFGSAQNDQGLASKGIFSFGAPSNNTAVNSGTASVPSSGFGFMSNSPAPTFSFGSNASTPNPAAPSLFGSSSNNVQAPTPGPIFGASSTGSFGNSNPSGGNSNSSYSTPTFNFGASGTQPSSNVFGFSGNQASGSASTPGQTFAASTPNFNFGQTQISAQTPGQPTLPTFNPDVKPTFNFTKGETPAFTAAAPSGSLTTGQRRIIKKAVRRAHPR